MDHARASVLPEWPEETLSLVYVACALLLSVESPVTRCGWHLAGTRALIDLVPSFLHSRVS
jgi:hypothetical protein